MRAAKLLVLPLCLFASLFAYPRVVVAQDRIPWLTDLAQARKVAERNQRLVLLHFWSESCQPCRELEHNVFNQPELIRVLANSYIPVKINVLQEPRLSDFYHIDRVPTDILVDASGKELHRQTSPATPNDYIAMLDQVRALAGSGIAGAGTANSDRFAQNANGSQLPPRADSSDGQSRSEPINTDPRTLAGSPESWRNGASGTGPTYPVGLNTGTAAGPQRTTMQNEFAVPGSSTEANAPGTPRSSDTSRYGNPYIQPEQALNNVKDVPNAASRYLENLAPRNAPPNAPQANATGQPVPQRNPVAGSDPAARGTPAQALGAAPGAAALGAAALGAAAMGGQAPGGLAPGATPAGTAAPGPGVTLPPNVPPLAMEGFCPVTLVASNKWVKGDARWGVIHRGRTYLLASQTDQQRFRTEPDRFSPALSGCDPVRFAETRQLVDGKREFGVYCANTYFLFSDESAMLKFENQPQGYVQLVRQAMSNNGTAPPQR